MFTGWFLRGDFISAGLKIEVKARYAFGHSDGDPVLHSITDNYR